ncbi:MAG TPA: lantibiotic ABC transporter ATP-binding protein [Clostridium sp.]|nr:lantibiotic ABC transporter ATP-binding protein [Clostridium sp.]
MNDYILETKSLCKNFKHDRVIKDVSLHIKRNTIYGLLGPNGAGKSTILKMITGMLHITSGNVIFDNHNFTRKDLKYIGSIIESAPLYENLNARDNLRVRTIALGLPESRIDKVLEIVDLKNTGKKKAGQFSMGMKQRLGIAIALLNNPKLLILDEPTNGLDPFGIKELRNLIKSFPSKGITVIISSHILSEIQLVADEIGIICGGVLGYEGKLNESDNLEELFMDIAGKYRREA